MLNGSFACSTKESGSSDIILHFDTANFNQVAFRASIILSHALVFPLSCFSMYIYFAFVFVINLSFLLLRALLAACVVRAVESRSGPHSGVGCRGCPPAPRAPQKFRTTPLSLKPHLPMHCSCIAFRWRRPPIHY